MTITERGVYVLVAGVLVAGGAVAAAQLPAFERELAEAKSLYREARFQEAIAKLEEVVVRFKPLRDVELRKIQLADAYLHLGLAHVAVNEGTAAKENLKDMLRLDPQRRLDPEVYAPKVVALVEEARAELRATSQAAASPPPSSVQGQGGASAKKASSTPWIIAGVGAAVAGAGIAVGSRGGGSPSNAQSTASTTTTTTTTTLPARRTDTFPFTLSRANLTASVTIGPIRARNGSLQVTLSYAGDYIILACVGPTQFCIPFGGRPGTATWDIPTNFPAGEIRAGVYFNPNFSQPQGDPSGTVAFTYNPQ